MFHVHHITVVAKINGSCPQYDDAGAAPEVRTERLNFGLPKCLAHGQVFAPSTHPLNVPSH